MADHPELHNLAHDFPEEKLKKIGERVVEDFERDEETRKGHMEEHAHWLRLYYQTDRPKNQPWEGSSDESIPLLAEGCNQFHARAYPAFFPNRDIIKAVQAGKVDKETADRAARVGKHMSWQLLTHDRTYKRKKDTLLLATPLHGSFFTKTYRDPMRRIPNVVDNVRINDLVLPYGAGPRAMEDIERKTQIIPMSVNRTRAAAAKGYFVSAAETYSQEDEADEVSEAHDEAQGIDKPDPGEEEGPAILLEQHRLIDLDDDGIDEPYIVTVDRENHKVLRLAVRWDVDPEGQPTDEKRPVEYFTHYPFLPNPDGVYGLGLGHLVGRINTAVNKLLRQSIDAGTLQNTKSGVVSEALGLQKGEIEMVMGKFIPVPAIDRLGDHFHEFQFSEPSATLQAIMQLLLQRGDRLQFVTEALTGQLDKIVQPTALLALIEQGLAPFTAVYERLWNAWDDELQKIYRLNRKYLDEEEYFTIAGANGPQQFQIGRADYADDLKISPAADPKLAIEKQKLAKAEAQWQFLSQNPLIQQNQEAFRIASLQYAELLEIEAADVMFAPPPPPQPVREDDAERENMAALMPNPKVPDVFPDQNHLEHLKSHDAFLVGPYADRIQKEGKDAMEAHIQMHVALLYGLTEADIDIDGGQAGPGRLPDMAQGPVDTMVPGGPGNLPAQGPMGGGDMGGIAEMEGAS